MSAAQGANWTVTGDGSGAFRSIQACADSARPGDACVVYPGHYPEHVKVDNGGTDNKNRVVFKARGIVTMQGFDIRRQFVTVDGFDISAYAAPYQGLITITAGGSNCEILNNTLHDAAAKVSSISFRFPGSSGASNCVIRGNTLSRAGYPMLNVNGDNHLFESNYVEYNNSQDYIVLFGAGSTFRRNVFWRGNTVETSRNHADFVQTFGAADLRSHDHVFEENWISDLPGAQLAQLNSGDGVVRRGVLYENVRNIIFRRNVIANVPYNANIDIPGVRFENNTFFRLAYALNGIGFGGSLTRGVGSQASLVNNAFVNGGRDVGGSGYYWISGSVYSLEVIGVLVTGEGATGGPISKGIFASLRQNGYVGSNGVLLSAATRLTDISSLVLDPAYKDYAQAVYKTLMDAVRLDQDTRDTFYADYNYVYPEKPAGTCEAGRYYANQKWCEPHGINGREGDFRNLSDLLGPDGIPFTLDDGLKPTPNSPLCGKGLGRTDIGAYSCDPTKVFAAAMEAQVPPPRKPVRR